MGGNIPATVPCQTLCCNPPLVQLLQLLTCKSCKFESWLWPAGACSPGLLLCSPLQALAPSAFLAQLCNNSCLELFEEVRIGVMGLRAQSRAAQTCLRALLAPQQLWMCSIDWRFTAQLYQTHRKEF